MRRLAALAAAPLLAACAFAAPAPAPAPAPPAPAPVPWRACTFGECAEVAVPLDHAVPDGRTITLAVARRPATGPRRGVLFVNPGGPGAPGRSLPQQLRLAGLEAWDVVGWDPRGVGGSGGFACLDPAAADAHLALDTSPDDAAERDALLASSRALGRGCRAAAGDLLDHLSSEDTARDLELLRQRLGAGALNYLGISYGTVIGARYADLFGEHVGGMVLDAAVDVNAPRVPQVVGFERALRRSGDEAAASVVRLLGRLEDRPLPVGERTLTQSLAVAGVAASLYAGEADRGRLLSAVASAEAGDGGPLLTAADALNGRTPDGGYGGLFHAFRAILCADGGTRSAERADAEWADARAAAPLLGQAFGPDYTCVDWPGRTPAPTVVTGARAAAPILVIGTTGDPASPYEWSEALAGDLATGVLLTVEGSAHGAVPSGSPCVRDAVLRYLADPGFTRAPMRC